MECGEKLLDALEKGPPPDLIVLDVVMPGIGGLETLRRLREQHPGIRVAMASAQSAVSVALEALELGADDYLVKGESDLSRILVIVRNTAERKALTSQIDALRARLGTPPGSPRLVGESSAMLRVYRLIDKAARSDISVVILGESGTGKELVAQTIREASRRREKPFVTVNCAAIPRELMESELFGHEKGSFTGAHERREGVFEQAHGGTLFLDEIGELDNSLQAKLLRVLQDGSIRRIGGKEEFEVDVRVLSATHRDIPQMVQGGEFREDLYYRLFQFPITVPPLVQRGADVLLIADQFLAEIRLRNPDCLVDSFSPQARRALMRHHWPGNVRELKNVVERAALLAETEQIMVEDLMLDAKPVDGSAAPLQDRFLSPQSLDEVLPLDELKQRAVQNALTVSDGNVEKAAEALGVSRSTVYRIKGRMES